MLRTFHDTKDGRGQNAIRAWLDAQGLQAKARINARLLFLEAMTGPWTRPYADTLAGDACKGLTEIRVKVQKVQYRLLCFYGPESGQVTILLGVKKNDGPLPCANAQQRMRQVISKERETCLHDYG